MGKRGLPRSITLLSLALSPCLLFCFRHGTGKRLTTGTVEAVAVATKSSPEPRILLNIHRTYVNHHGTASFFPRCKGRWEAFVKVYPGNSLTTLD